MLVNFVTGGMGSILMDGVFDQVGPISKEKLVILSGIHIHHLGLVSLGCLN